MQANIEKISTLERRLNVSLPVQEIDGEIQNRLKRLARNVRMHGFRPGKVPFRIVQQQYGVQVRQEVVGDALRKTFGEAIKQQNLRVAGYPRFEAKPSKAQDNFEFSATFEVYPDIQLGAVENVVIERPTLELDEFDVDKTIEILRKQRIRYEQVPRAAQLGDRVTIDYLGTLAGQAFEGGSGSDQVIVLGEGRLLADFEQQVVGLTAGQSKTFELTFPEDYHAKDVAGKTAQFELTLKSVEQPLLPEVDQEFAKQLGIADGDLVKMRAEIRANLEREVKRRVQARVKEQVMKALVANAALELPKSLVELEIEGLIAGMRKDLAARGVKDDATQVPRDAFEPEARRRVALGLIVSEVVRQNGLQAKPDQVKAVIQEYAQSYERPEEVVRWYYQSAERLREVESLVLEDNVVQWALSRMKTEDKPAVFDELMGGANK